MSSDALREIGRHLDVSSCLALAQVDESTYEIASKWRDVHSMMIEACSVSVWSGTMMHKFTKLQTLPEDHGQITPLRRILSLCPSVQTLYIQKQLSSADIADLRGRTRSVRRLYIALDNFFKMNSVSWLGVELPHLHELIISPVGDTLSKSLLFRLPEEAYPILLPVTLTSVTLSGLVLSCPLILHLVSLPSLRQLNLLGSIIDYKHAQEVTPRIAEKTWDDLRLPPSLYSLSSRERNKDVKFSLRNTSVQRLSLYVEYFDELYAMECLKNLMPLTLKELTLYGNTARMKDNPKFNITKQFNIKYASSHSVIYVNGGDPLEYRILSNLVYSHPYTEVRTGDIIPVESWIFDLEAAERQAEEEFRRLVPGARPAARNIAQANPRRRPAPNRARQGGPLALPVVASPPIAFPAGPVQQPVNQVQVLNPPAQNQQQHARVQAATQGVDQAGVRNPIAIPVATYEAPPARARPTSRGANRSASRRVRVNAPPSPVAIPTEPGMNSSDTRTDNLPIPPQQTSPVQVAIPIDQSVANSMQTPQNSPQTPPQDQQAEQPQEQAPAAAANQPDEEGMVMIVNMLANMVALIEEDEREAQTRLTVENAERDRQTEQHQTQAEGQRQERAERNAQNQTQENGVQPQRRREGEPNGSQQQQQQREQRQGGGGNGNANIQ